MSAPVRLAARRTESNRPMEKETMDKHLRIALSRRTAVSGMAVEAAAAAIAFVPLLVGGIVPDMPSGPVDVRISRLAMAPGTVIDAYAVPYPALMYIETGTTAGPGGPGRIGYGADGTVIGETTGEEVQYTPADVPDGAGNERTALMSSIVIEFVPVEGEATPAAGM